MTNTFNYSNNTNKKVLDYLLANDFFSKKDASDLQSRAKKKGELALKVFLHENPELIEKTTKLISHLSSVPYFDHTSEVLVKKHEILNPENAKKYGAYLVSDGGSEKLLCMDPENKEFKGLKKTNFKRIQIVIMSQVTFDYIEKNYEELAKKTEENSKLEGKSKIEIIEADDADSADANKYVYNMLKECVEKEASDIHIDLALGDKRQRGFKLRYRVDGKCFDESFHNDIMLYRGIVNKLKLDAGLKIDERRLPQDGRISFELNEKVYNFRLSFMPSTIRNAQEEKIVLRQMADLNKCNLYDLGIHPFCLELLKKAITYPHGFICVTGPTGSGKTTTLYALLQEIDRASANVMTLEDPIEAEIPLVNQSQMFHRIGYDFASGLRVILRQDPDIIMVGEMRDEETALKAFEAANTGHLVFSTLHTNTAASSITRLLQMQVPHYFISSSLKFIVAQRLVRRICTECCKKHPDEKNVLAAIGSSFKDASKEVKDIYNEARKNNKLFAPYPNGGKCGRCDGAGYKGRVGIMEIMQVDDEIRHVVNFDSGNEDKIQEIAEKNGMLTIQQYGYLQVLEGKTTFEEVNNAVLSV